MCGILFLKGIDAPRARLEAGVAALAHRGPDHQALECHKGEGVVFGHTRLKILDLDDRANQPFTAANGRYSMIYNGEIYNFRELAKRFDIEMRTASDTELLLRLYVKLGRDMLQYLNGMFAFVIYDHLSKDYFAARDRLGVKPLYRATLGDGVIFASEAAAILEILPNADIDEFALRQYRKLRSFFNGRTLYRQIEMFPAGYCEDTTGRRRYWTLPDGEQAPPEDGELFDLVQSAVEYRCISDVAVGSFLSGGIDSTIVAALSGKPHTWTVGTNSNNEFEWAQLAADHLGTDHCAVVVDPAEFVPTARQMIEARREPLSVPNEVLLCLMTRRVATRNTVVLSGEGADELFFGYDRIFRWAMDQRDFDLRQFSERYAYGSADDMEVVEDALAPFMGAGSPIQVVASFFQLAHLHGLLRRLDNSTMAWSVEARVPFTDYRLVERMAGVPGEYRMSDGVVKAPLKRVFRKFLPEAIVERDKVGFPVDLRDVGIGRNGSFDDWFEFNLATLGINPLNQGIATR